MHDEQSSLCQYVLFCDCFLRLLPMPTLHAPWRHELRNRLGWSSLSYVARNAADATRAAVGVQANDGDGRAVILCYLRNVVALVR